MGRKRKYATHDYVRTKDYYDAVNSTIRGKMRFWKRRAKMANLEWNLDYEYLMTLPQDFCYLSGERMTLDVNNENVLSLDRIDSTKGYVRGNVAFCCKWVNRMKMDLQNDDFRAKCGKIILRPIKK